MIVSFYNSVRSKKPYYKKVEVALNRIRSGASSDVVGRVRSGHSDAKKELPCVIFSGKMSAEGREDSHLIEHSGLMVLDFDHVNVEATIERLKNDQYIFAAWRSPSGDGVKALVRVRKSIRSHEGMFNALRSRYPELDSTGSNPSRLCFESYDPDLYHNPDSIEWKAATDKVAVTSMKEQNKKRREFKLLATAISMVRMADEGEKHYKLRDAANLLGGYVGAGRLELDEAESCLREEIEKKKGVKDLEQAYRTIKEGLEYGMAAPLYKMKKIEKEQEYIRRMDGSYDFLADEKEMDDYEQAVINGTLEMGLPTMLPEVDPWWAVKKNHLVWFAGRDNVGKSFVVWYLSVLVAAYHGWKFVIFSKENGDGNVRKKLKEFYIGKPLDQMTDEEYNQATAFVKEHFVLFTSKQWHSIDEFLIMCEVIFDEGFEFDCVVAEPFNSFKGVQEYQSMTDAMNQLQTFSKDVASVWVCDHIYTGAARNIPQNGEFPAPNKWDVENGQMKPNKVDDFIIFHRNTRDKTKYRIMEWHTDKVKDVETGGKPSDRTDPPRLISNKDLCGFTSGGKDPIKELWIQRGKKPVTSSDSSERLNRIGSWDKGDDSHPFS